MNLTGTANVGAILPLLAKENPPVPLISPFTGRVLLREPPINHVFDVRASYGDEVEKLCSTSPLCKGKNNKTSYSEKYLEELFHDNVRNPNDAARNYPYGASLAFNTYLINPIFDGGGNVTGYETAANPSTGLNQENTVKTKGGITDISLGMGVNVKEQMVLRR